MLLNKVRWCNIKKYFKFTKLKECYKSSIALIIVIIWAQCYNSNMSISEIIITDLIMIALWIFSTLVIDWIRIKNNNSKDRNSKE